MTVLDGKRRGRRQAHRVDLHSVEHAVGALDEHGLAAGNALRSSAGTHATVMPGWLLEGISSL